MYTEAHRAAKRRQYDSRLRMAFDMLGERCARCDSTVRLEFDHVDPKTKVVEIAAATRLSLRRFLDEVAKCQVLCSECHDKKSALERGLTPTKGEDVHGTLSSYRYCRCDVCRDAKSAAGHTYRRSKGIAPRAPYIRDHGTYALYRKGCRCSLCKAANTARIRKWLDNRKIGA